MNSPQDPKTAWPPIIVKTDMSVWLRLRDAALAVVGWIILQDLLFDFWVLMYDWLKYPIFILDPNDAPDWDAIYARLEPFLIGAAVLVASIVVTGVWRRKFIGRSHDAADGGPAGLEPDFHVMHLSADSLSELQRLDSADVYVNEQGDIDQVRARPRAPATPQHYTQHPELPRDPR